LLDENFFEKIFLIMNVSMNKLRATKELKNEIDEEVKIQFRKEQKIMRSISHVRLSYFISQCLDV